MFRIDSAYYSAAVLGAIRRGGACFSVTVRMDPKIRAAIASISEDAWTPITYPHAIWDEDQGRLISYRRRRDHLGLAPPPGPSSLEAGPGQFMEAQVQRHQDVLRAGLALARS